MTRTSSFIALSSLLTVCCVAGCQAGNGPAVVEVLNNGNCTGAQIGLHQVSYADVAKLRGSTLLSMSTPGSADATTPELLLFALSKGRQPTPGYAFSLKQAKLTGGVAELTFAWQEPAPGSVQAQVITLPCIVVGIEPGDYTVVRALAEDDELLGEVRL